MRRAWIALIVLTCSGFLAVEETRAADACAPHSSFGSISDSYRFSTPGLLEPQELNDAIGIWNACSGTPRLSRHSGETHVRVVRGIGPNSGCATRFGNEITIWFQRDDSKPDGVGRRNCGYEDLKSVLLHEIGHVLGLADTYDAGACGRRVMYGHAVPNLQRKVTTADCASAKERYQPKDEEHDGDRGGGSGRRNSPNDADRHRLNEIPVVDCTTPDLSKAKRKKMGC